MEPKQGMNEANVEKPPDLLVFFVLVNTIPYIGVESAMING